MTVDPRLSIETMTAFIAATGIGDVATGTIAYKTIFAVGLTLFVMTLVLNLFAIRMVRKFREVYDDRDDTASRAFKENAFRLYLCFSVAIGVVALGALLLRVLIDCFGYRGQVLLFNPPSSNPDKAGARPAILATAVLGLVFGMAVPGGIATAIWLEEFAKKDRWYNRFLELNIQNLAGVPSIVYGILGLAFLVRASASAACSWPAR